MTKEEITKYAKGIMVIKPFSDLASHETRWAVVQPADPFRVSCIYNDTIPGKEVVVRNKNVLGSFCATHTFGHPSLFKPSLAEVIEAMPEVWLKECNAVHIQYDGFNSDSSKHLSIVTAYNVEDNHAQ